MQLHENIYRLRTARNMSQGDLAEALEVSRQSVSKWETGAAVPELDKLDKMAQLFGVTLDQLVHGIPSADTPESDDTKPAISFTNNDLISFGLLFIGIIFPLLVFFVSDIRMNIVLEIVFLFATPPLVTLAASFLSTNNKLIRRIYLVYDIIISAVCFLALLGNPIIALIPWVINTSLISYWCGKVVTSRDQTGKN